MSRCRKTHTSLSCPESIRGLLRVSRAAFQIFAGRSCVPQSQFMPHVHRPSVISCSCVAAAARCGSVAEAFDATHLPKEDAHCSCPQTRAYTRFSFCGATQSDGPCCSECQTLFSGTADSSPGSPASRSLSIVGRRQGLKLDGIYKTSLTVVSLLFGRGVVTLLGLLLFFYQHPHNPAVR